MEPTDQPPPPPQSWAETSAWAPSGDNPESPGAPGAPATWAPPPPAVQQGPSEDAFVRPASALPDQTVRIRRERSPLKWLVLAAVITELIAIGAGDNQWVTKKALDYGAGGNGFMKQFVYSTQTFAWRANRATGESTSQWAASLVLIATVLVLTALLVGLLVRRGSFARAAAGSLLATVFATQVAVIVGGIVYDGPHSAIYHSAYAPLSDVGLSGYSSTLSVTVGGGGGRATRALFGAPSGYTVVGGLMLGIIVGLVVGILARRFGEPEPKYVQRSAPTPQAVPQAFFGPGDMERTYQASGQGAVAPQLAEPGSVPPKDVGRHARGGAGSY